VIRRVHVRDGDLPGGGKVTVDLHRGEGHVRTWLTAGSGELRICRTEGCMVRHAWGAVCVSCGGETERVGGSG